MTVTNSTLTVTAIVAVLIVTFLLLKWRSKNRRRRMYRNYFRD